MFEGLFQPAHLILILVVVLIIFGPGKLPEVGSALGRGIREFRNTIRDGASGPAPDGPALTSTGQGSGLACPHCGATYQPGQRFCGQCGKALAA